MTMGSSILVPDIANLLLSVSCPYQTGAIQTVLLVWAGMPCLSQFFNPAPTQLPLLQVILMNLPEKKKKTG